MKKYIIVVISAILLQSCSVFSMLNREENIAGIKLVSLEDISNEEGVFKREIRGVIPAPFETDDEWIFAFKAIHGQKKVAGHDLIIKIYLTEDNWEMGTPYAIGKFKETKQASIKVDGQPLKIKPLPKPKP